MKYMGSKARFAKYLLPILLKNRVPEQVYVEPFAGGMNMIDKVTGVRIANDQHEELMAMWQALIYDNWDPPKSVTEEDYRKLERIKINIPNIWLVMLVLILLVENGFLDTEEISKVSVIIGENIIEILQNKFQI
eukprot:TRINITY_DN15078_c0_g1_i1.p1 TRINITY_DN15078_c0_g1~~TRINITY_DN15078_c0_g1_i1.p1  ORF type:complete len:134 (+),score=27.62 TRINITY_DN15078_c0_g1_i1:235-636(+)